MVGELLFVSNSIWKMEDAVGCRRCAEAGEFELLLACLCFLRLDPPLKLKGIVTQARARRRSVLKIPLRARGGNKPLHHFTIVIVTFCAAPGENEAVVLNRLPTDFPHSPHSAGFFPAKHAAQLGISRAIQSTREIEAGLGG